MLSRSAEYAVRALAYLAVRGENQWLLTRQVGEDLGIPPTYLVKILHTLAGEGILESQRGRNGGFRLARDPETLSLYEIVEPFDRLGHRQLCVLGQKTCSDETACPLHNAWHSTLSSFLKALNDTSLAEIGREMPGGFPRGDRRPAKTAGVMPLRRG